MHLLEWLYLSKWNCCAALSNVCSAVMLFQVCLMQHEAGYSFIAMVWKGILEYSLHTEITMWEVVACGFFPSCSWNAQVNCTAGQNYLALPHGSFSMAVSRIMPMKLECRIHVHWANHLGLPHGSLSFYGGREIWKGLYTIGDSLHKLSEQHQKKPQGCGFYTYVAMLGLGYLEIILLFIYFNCTEIFRLLEMVHPSNFTSRIHPIYNATSLPLSFLFFF